MCNRQTSTLVAFVVILTSLFFDSQCDGQLTDHVWLGGNGAWSDQSRWDIGVSPFGKNARVYIDHGNAVSSAVTINADAQFHSLHLDSNDELQINHELEVFSEIINAGMINAANLSSITYASGTVLRGGGVLNLEGATFFTNDYSVGPGLVNLDNTISGHSVNQTTAGNAVLRMTNYAFVVADTAAEELEFYGHNFGVARATNGGRLIWRGAGVNTGTLIAGAGSRVTVGGSQSYPARGGSVIAEGGTNPGNVRTSGYIEDMEFFGDVETVGVAQFRGKIANHDQWKVFPGATVSLGQVTLVGGGTIDLSGGSFQSNSPMSNDGSLTNVDNRIHGAGLMELYEFYNGGILEADVSQSTLNVTFNSDGDPGNFTNTGTIRAANGARLVINAVGNDARQLANSSGTIEIGVSSTFESNVPVIAGTVTGPDVGLPRGTLSATLVDAAVSGNLNFSGGIGDSLVVSDQLTISSMGVTVSGDYVELSGGGELYFDGGTLDHQRNTNAHTTLLNQDLTIRGSGSIRLHRMHNRGSIVASPSLSSASLSILTDVADVETEFTNDGSIVATGGSSLSLPAIDNRGGSLFAEHDSTISVREVWGGTITSTGNGVVSTSLIDNLKNNGTIVPSGNFSVVRFGGHIVNNGTIRKTAAAQDWFGLDENGVTLAGSGQLEILGNTNAFGPIINESSHTISGSGLIVSNVIINLGTFTTTTGIARLELQPGRFLNYGEISGNLVFNRGDRPELSLTNSGNFRPWKPGTFLELPVGLPNSGARFENAVDGTLEIVIGADESTAVIVGGTADLAGTLVLELVDAVAYGQEYVILTTESGGLYGTFDRVEGALINENMALATTYHDGVAIPVDFVRVTVALPGDANLDGTVDGADFLIWSGSKFTSGGTWSTGDFNGDGFVDGFDFLLWNTNKFSSISSVVPEPPSAPICFLVGLTAAFLWRGERAIQ